MIIAWLSKLLLFFISLYFAHRVRSFLARLFSPSYSSRNQSSKERVYPGKSRSTIAGKMVKDPQCGMYVDVSLAITTRVNGQELYFCSADCREGFIAGIKKAKTQKASS